MTCMEKMNGHEALQLAMNKENFRAYIKVRTALNFQLKVIHHELHFVFDDQAPSYPTVAKQSKWFREGQEVIKDSPPLIDL